MVLTHRFSFYQIDQPVFFRFASFTSLLTYFSGLGIEDSCQLLTALLSEEKNSKIDLVALSRQMIEDLFENVDNILTVRASLSCLVRELLNVKTSLDCLLNERDKLRNDLMVSFYNRL